MAFRKFMEPEYGEIAIDPKLRDVSPVYNNL